MNGDLSFGRWLQRRREALAGRVGCALETIRKIERDVRRPSKQIAERLADQLDLAPDERATFVQLARATAHADQLPLPPITAPPRRTPAHPSGTLPVPPTPLIGPSLARCWRTRPAG